MSAMVSAKIYHLGITHCQMTRLAAVVAASTGSTAAKAQSRAVGLNVTETLAVVALFCLCRSRKGAAVGLVARLLAYVCSLLERPSRESASGGIVQL